MKRILKVRYSPDFEKKKITFMKQYHQYEKECNQRNIKIEIEKITSRSQLFEIKLYGYDKKLKWVTNKTNSIPLILSIIDSMPMGKIEKKSINLYTDAHPETTIHGLGFKGIYIQKNKTFIQNGTISYYPNYVSTCKISSTSNKRDA